MFKRWLKKKIRDILTMDIHVVIVSENNYPNGELLLEDFKLDYDIRAIFLNGLLVIGWKDRYNIDECDAGLLLIPKDEDNAFYEGDEVVLHYYK